MANKKRLLSILILITFLVYGCATVPDVKKVKEYENFTLKNPRYTLIKNSYEIHNQSSEMIEAIDAYISIPPDTINQRIIDFKLDSQLGHEIIQDKWGQKIAHYQLKEIKPGSKIVLSWTAKAEISEIKYHIDPQKVESVAEIPESIMKQYTADGYGYQLNNQAVQDKAKEVVGKETNIFYKAKKIHDFVVDHMKYNYTGKWKRAAELLEKGEGSCSEYTFLFIALCRASGIPARYSGGTIRQESWGKFKDDIGHRWAEIYLPIYGWVPIDVTWDDRPRAFYQYFCNLDNRHFTMTIGGGDSEYLAWLYNSHVKGKNLGGKIKVKAIAEWIPLSAKEVEKLSH